MARQMAVDQLQTAVRCASNAQTIHDGDPESIPDPMQLPAARIRRRLNVDAQPMVSENQFIARSHADRAIDRNLIPVRGRASSTIARGPVVVRLDAHMKARTSSPAITTSFSRWRPTVTLPISGNRAAVSSVPRA
jgi:hypothetical protein